MNRTGFQLAIVTGFFLFAILLVGCEISDDDSSGETPMTIYYSMEDFHFIKMGETTFQDIYTIAPGKQMQVTSYGGMCEYPTQTGGKIIIKFYGKNLVVGAMEETPKQ